MTAALNAEKDGARTSGVPVSPLHVETSETGPTLQLTTQKGEVVYRFETNTADALYPGPARDSPHRCEDLGNAS